MNDTKILTVAFNGLENILIQGEKESKITKSDNPYTIMIEECHGKSTRKITSFVNRLTRVFILLQDWIKSNIFKVIVILMSIKKLLS